MIAHMFRPTAQLYHEIRARVNQNKYIYFALIFNKRLTRPNYM